MNKDGRIRDNITKGAEVLVVMKQDQRTGRLTRGIVRDILTRSDHHSRGIKVRLDDGKVGRVQEILTHETIKSGSSKDGVHQFDRSTT